MELLSVDFEVLLLITGFSLATMAASSSQKFSKNSSKNRLDKMESKTMSMLIATGVGVMVLLIISVLILMNASG